MKSSKPSLDLTFRNTTGEKGYRKLFFQKILDEALTQTPGRYLRVEVSVSLVSPASIRQLNKKYRKKDKITDVLSFPLNEPYPLIQNIGGQPKKGYTTLILGDLFLCLPYAKKKAKEQGVSTKEYVAWMTVHGFLHLKGYDHEKSRREAKTMFCLEEQIMGEYKAKNAKLKSQNGK